MAKAKEEAMKELMQAKFPEKKPEPQSPAQEVVLDNGRSLPVKSVRLRYLRDGDFGFYRIVDRVGVEGLFAYPDGGDGLCRFLSAVFDRPYEKVSEKQEDGHYEERYVFDPYIMQLFEEELTLADARRIIEAAKAANGIRDENFQEPRLTD